MSPTFHGRLAASQRRASSVLCVGLDPDPELFPAPLESIDPVSATIAFCRAIIDATAAHACAFKVNFAFFEALGDESVRALRAVRRAVPDSIPVIADAKRGDIGNTARFYARSIFDDLGFDAVTLAPYMGADSVLPFVDDGTRAAFVLARTSNPGARDFQYYGSEGTPLYLHVARTVAQWQTACAGTLGLVVGATAPDALAELRGACGTMPFLVPGVGAQGGDAVAVMASGYAGPGSLLVNSSRAICYASRGADFEEAAARAARSAAQDLSPLD